MERRRLVQVVAERAHEMNRLYCAQLGDESHLPWKQTPQDLKASVMAGVQQIIENPTITPEQNHELWMQRKLAEGWRYAAFKSTQHKTHPCLVAYEELPFAERMKDVIFGAVVRAQLAHAGLEGF